MLLTQRQAFTQIKSETGLREVDVLSAIEKMPKRLVGARQKVHVHHVRLAISAANEIPQLQVKGVRSISMRHAQKLGAK